MVRLHRSLSIGHDRIYKLYPDMKANPKLEITSIQDVFCGCGTVLQPEFANIKFRQGGHQIIVELFVANCVLCGAKFDVSTWRETWYTRKGGIRKMLVIEKQDMIDILPTARRNCKKCNRSTKHITWSRQLRSADESETTFYRCSVCSTTQRESL